MSKIFKRGDHVEWNSEAGTVRGVIVKKSYFCRPIQRLCASCLKRRAPIHHQE